MHGTDDADPALEEIIDRRVAAAVEKATAGPSKDDLETRVMRIMEDRILETQPAKIIRWLLPLAGALLLGGTLWASLEVKGLRRTIVDEINGFTNEVKEKSAAAITATKSAQEDAAKAMKVDTDSAQTDVQSAATTAKQTLEATARPPAEEFRTLAAPIRTETARRMRNEAKGVVTALRGDAAILRAHIQTRSAKIPDRLADLEQRTATVAENLDGFKTVAGQITEANRVLTMNPDGTRLAQMAGLLQHAVMVLVACGFVSGAVAAAAVLLVARRR